MVQSELYRIPNSLLRVADRLVKHPNMHASFALGASDPKIFYNQIVELDSVVHEFNRTSIDWFPADMKNARTLKDIVRSKGVQLPLVLDDWTQKTAKYREAYRRMLYHGNTLLGPHFHFHEAIEDLEQRLAAGLLDASGLFVPYLLQYSGEKVKKVQVIAVNALCEILAEQHAAEPNSSISLFGHVKKSGWYMPKYGFEKAFLVRHNILFKKKKV